LNEIHIDTIKWFGVLLLRKFYLIIKNVLKNIININQEKNYTLNIFNVMSTIGSMRSVRNILSYSLYIISLNLLEINKFDIIYYSFNNYLLI